MKVGVATQIDCIIEKGYPEPTIKWTKKEINPDFYLVLRGVYSHCIFLSACLCVHASLCLCLEIVFSFSKERVVQTVSRGVWAKRLLGGFGRCPPPVALPVQIISVCEYFYGCFCIFLFLFIYICRLRKSY